ncbi:HNH endonuclease, partial [Glaciibacter sp. 2TAF33]
APGAGRDRFRGTKPDLIVTVPMLTLLGVTEEPGNLDGYGPIDPDTARDLASRCPTAIRILTHPETGATLSVGRDRYTVPADLKRLLEIRDGTCRAPFSNRPVRQTDLDHTLDWQYHGESAHNNLAHLSRAAHILKHQAGWTYTQARDGSGTLTWTTPTGHTYITEPDTPITATLHPTATTATA